MRAMQQFMVCTFRMILLPFYVDIQIVPSFIIDIFELIRFIPKCYREACKKFIIFCFYPPMHNKDGARPALFQNFCVVLCIVGFVSFCVLCLCKCVLYCTVLYCTVLYCTVLYCTVLYCTVLYCTTATGWLPNCS